MVAARVQRAAVDDGTAGIGVGAGQISVPPVRIPHRYGDHAGKSTGRGGKRQGCPQVAHCHEPETT